MTNPVPKETNWQLQHQEKVTARSKNQFLQKSDAGYFYLCEHITKLWLNDQINLLKTEY